MNVESRARKQIFSKEFKIRDAPITTKLENSEDAKSIYNVCVILFVALLAYTALDEYTKTWQSYFGFRLIYLGFNKLHWVILVWITSNILVCLSYVCFNIWAHLRTILAPKGQKVWDTLWSTVLILYYFAFLYVLQIIGNSVNFAQNSATIVFTEQVRLLMKQYAFIRSNVPRVLLVKAHGDEMLRLPTFGKFMYFMFAPTMTYKDEYPRTQCIRWKFVISNFAQLFGIMWFASLVVERFLVLTFQDICIRNFTLGEIVTPVLTNMVPGVVFMLLGFYTALHTSQNVFAEILRFGDRQFYKEWWHSKSLAEFHRTWNLLVQDWLYEYIYRDVYEIVVPKNKLAARFTVFFVSAIFHEWLFTNVLGFFLPIHSILFLITGALFASINILDAKWGNFLVLYSLGFGAGIQANLFAIEYFARNNCPLNNNATFVELYTPRFITCGCIAV